MPSGKLCCEARELDAGALVSLVGVIDESAADALYAPTGDRTVLFDLDGVRRISSYGVLHWRRTLDALQSPTYYFARVRPAMVRQFNMIAGFGGKGQLLSIYAPYYCEECDAEFQRLHDLAADPRIMLQRRLPVTTCKCGAQAELDEALGSYLAFAEDYPVPKLDKDLRTLLAALRRPADQDASLPSQPLAAGG